MRTKTLPFRASAFLPLIVACALVFVPALVAQQAGRFLGTITAINGTSLMVKTDSGETHQFDVPATAILKRIAPGQKDLSTAATIQLTDLATGDRVLVRLDPNAPAGAAQVAQIVAIKQADVAQKQQQDREDWQRNGAGGLVKSVDPAAGVIVLTSGVGQTMKIINVHVSPATVLKRYAPGSIRYDQAQVAPIAAIQPGDQLRARGTRNADGTDIQATEIVSGSFRNVSGVISSLDASSTSFTLKDLQSKKQVTIHITSDSQMHALPETMARVLATRLKGGSAASGNGARSVPANDQRGGNGPSTGGNGPSSGQGPTGQARAQSGDMQQLLNRAPAIQFSDLKKGDAVMLVATSGATDVNAITLLTGVEPLLESPEASRDLLSDWSVGSSAGGEAAAQ